MPSPSPLGAVFRLTDHEDVVRMLHIETVLRRGHRHVVCRSTSRPPGPAPLPPRTRVLHVVHGPGGEHVLATVDKALVLLVAASYGTEIVVSADRQKVAARVADELQAMLPAEVDDGRFAVTFSDFASGVREVRLALRSWESSRAHYAPEVQRALDALVAHVPDLDTARRLLLWHGAPGTGKTSAVRALMHAWREWARPLVVTDPERLLSEGQYLRRLLLDDDDLDDERWHLLVLEDAEALLRKDTGGTAMSKLLNLTDGLLGQGLRCLFLITTNEPLAAVHPAIVRPGRCLAQVEFGRLPAQQAAALLGSPVSGPMTLAEVLSRRPVETDDGPAPAVGLYL
jgi:hypothetical protein